MNELEKRFPSHELSPEQAAQFTRLRVKTMGLAYLIDACPVSSERGQALTHLELALYHAKAAIYRHGVSKPVVVPRVCTHRLAAPGVCEVDNSGRHRQLTCSVHGHLIKRLIPADE